MIAYEFTFFFCFSGPHPWHMEIRKLGVGAAAAGLHQKHSNAVTVTYTTAHGNAGSLTH